MESEGLTSEDLARTVRIRGESQTVLRTICRSVSHCAYHVGQLVYVARLLVGPEWQTLSIPRGGSQQYNQAPPPYQDRSPER
jgi:hypothetical protein